jgi:hypothetical protein
MRHCLESSVAFIHGCPAKAVMKDFRNWSRIARVEIQHRDSKGIRARLVARAPSMQDKPAVYKDLMESTNLYNLKGGIGILKESNTSLVQNEHIICIFGAVLAHPLQNDEKSRTDESYQHRHDNVWLCRSQIDKRPARVRARLQGEGSHRDG